MNTTKDTTMETTDHMIGDLANWNAGVCVAMINLVDDQHLTGLARADWDKGLRLAREYADMTPENRAGQRLANALLLAALVQSPYAVQSALKELHRQLANAEPALARTFRPTPRDETEHESYIATAAVDPDVRKRIRQEFIVDLAGKLGRLTHELGHEDDR